MYKESILLLIVNIILSNCQNYYVHPNGDGSNCPRNVSCNELAYYYDNDFFKSNTSFFFIEGIHVIPSNWTYLISNVANLTLQGLGRRKQGFHETVMQSTAIINCESRTSNIIFMFSSNIILKSLTITNCGRLLLKTSQMKNYLLLLLYERAGVFSLLGDNATVVAVEVHNLSINEFSAQNNSGFGFLALNAFGLEIYNSSFSQNNLNACFEGCPVLYFLGANLAILYTNPFYCPSSPTIYKASIVNTNVSFCTNLNISESLSVHSSAGLQVSMEQTGMYGVDLIIDNVVAYGNTAVYGANMAVIIMSSVTYYTVLISRFNSSYGNVIYPLASYGDASSVNIQHTGLLVHIGVGTRIMSYQCGYKKLRYADYPIKIENSVFLHNFGGGTGALGIYYIQTLKLNSLQVISIENVYFKENIGFLGIGITLYGEPFHIGAPISYIIKDVTMEYSVQYWPANPYTNLTGSTLFISTVYNLTITGLHVKNNDANGALVIGSQIFIIGENSFTNNTGYNGGGISFFGNSFLMLYYPAVIYFIDNHAANTGGAMYVDQTSFVNNICFLQVKLNPDHVTNKTNGISCYNNTANLSGSVLYGGNIDKCNLLPATWINLKFPNSSVLFNETIHYSSSNDSNISLISSDAIRACFCNGHDPDCSLYSTIEEGYPGQIVYIPIVTVGQRFGTTTATLKVVEVTKGEEIGQILKSWQPICQDFTYTVNVKNYANVIPVTTELKISVLIENYANVPIDLKTNITVNITILDCPPGFELLPTSGHCGCSSELLSVLSTTQCNASSQIISKQGNVWMGYNTNKHCVIAHKNCPFDYCLLSLVSFNITSPDNQCALNRSGVLCGECANGLSLLLGSNKCGTCDSNSYLALLIIFILAGFALVVFLLLLNFTVSLGMINGLIFFANIIKLNEATFFPSGPIIFLSQFISWLNLDLGIETCFYNGMDSYVKVWLQFVFPFYIWVIIIIIILLAEHTKLGRLIGHNTVPVLATLILLSYMKLLRTVTLALAFVKYECGQSTTHYSWYMDPNIEYLSVKHIILFTFAIIVVCLLIIPFTIILLFIQLLEWRVSNWRGCRFLYKLKPFFDAFGGPFKDRYRFWPGFLLTIRLVLLVVTSFNNNTSTTTAAIITCVVVILTLIANFGGVYRKGYNNFFETVFFVLLTAMSAFVSNNNLSSKVPLSLAFVIFVVIILYHVYLRIKGYKAVKKFREIFVKKPTHVYSREEIESLVLDHEDEDIKKLFGTYEITDIAPRESMIYDDK